MIEICEQAMLEFSRPVRFCCVSFLSQKSFVCSHGCKGQGFNMHETLRAIYVQG